MTKSSRKWWPPHPFRDKGILPTARLIKYLVSLTIPISLAAIWNLGWIVFFTCNATLLIASVLDLWRLPRRHEILCTRHLDQEVERGLDFQVRLHIQNQSGSPITFRLIDGLPESFLRPFPLHGQLHGRESTEVTYTSNVSVRGDYALNQLYFRYHSRLGLWEKQLRFSMNQTVKVIPNMSQVRDYLAVIPKFLMLEGNKVKKKQVGKGEFAQVRPYVTGDDPRNINWRQTAKLAELMTNEYEPEHGKQITLLIDCGRMMGIELAIGNRLEHSMEAALMVAAVALQQGDYVSVLVFSNQVKTYIPPGKGLGHLQTIIKNTYHIQCDPFESNVAEAFHHLEMVQKRRSFIFLFSDLDSFLLHEISIQYIQRIRRKHLVFIMSIADPMVAKWVKIQPADTNLALIKSMAQKEVFDRKLGMRRMGKWGLQTIEVPEDQLAVQAFNRYMDVMNQGLL